MQRRRRIQYAAVPREDDDIGNGAPVVFSQASSCAQLETDARQQRGMPSSGPIFCKFEGFWISLDQFEEPPGGVPLQLKLVGKLSSA